MSPWEQLSEQQRAEWMARVGMYDPVEAGLYYNRSVASGIDPMALGNTTGEPGATTCERVNGLGRAPTTNTDIYDLQRGAQPVVTGAPGPTGPPIDYTVTPRPQITGAPGPTGPPIDYTVTPRESTSVGPAPTPAAPQQTAQAPMGSTPAIAPQYPSGGGDYGRNTGGAATGGGSSGSSAATGGLPTMAPPMPGQQSEWSRILHESGALQTPGMRIPFDQYPNRGAMFDPYMRARGWAPGGDPASAQGAVPSVGMGNGAAMGGGANIAPPPVGAQVASPLGQNTPPTGPGMSVPPPNPLVPGPNVNSPTAPASPLPALGSAPVPAGGSLGPPPSSPYPMGPGSGSPEEAMILAGHMNAMLRKRYGGY